MASNRRVCPMLYHDAVLARDIPVWQVTQTQWSNPWTQTQVTTYHVREHHPGFRSLGSQAWDWDGSIVEVTPVVVRRLDEEVVIQPTPLWLTNRETHYRSVG